MLSTKNMAFEAQMALRLYLKNIEGLAFRSTEGKWTLATRNIPLPWSVFEKSACNRESQPPTCFSFYLSPESICNIQACLQVVGQAAKPLFAMS